MRYVSAEKQLFRSVMNQLYQSDLLNGIDIHDRPGPNIGYDKNGNKLFPFTYIIAGETSITKQYSSQSHSENIAITFHLYHRDKTDEVVDNTRDLLERLDYVVQQYPQMDHYKVEKIRCDNKQTITDIDLETMHGILRMQYTVKHLTRRGLNDSRKLDVNRYSG